MRALAILLGSVLPVVAAAGPFDGLYRPSGAGDWDCREIGMEGGALAVAEGRIDFIEGFCRLENPVAVRGMAAVLYDGACVTEGRDSAQRLLLMKHADRGGLYVISDGQVLDWIACEGG